MLEKYEKELDYLKEICKPLKDYLEKNYNVHTNIIVSQDRIEIVQGILGVPVDDANDVRGVKG